MRKTIDMITLILACGMGILLVLYGCFHIKGLFALLVTVITTWYHFAMRLLVGWLCRLWFPEHVAADRGWFRERPWEKGLYQKLRVHQWKGFLPTYLEQEFDFQALSPETLLRNMCKSELGHEIILLLSFVPLLFSAFAGNFAVFLFTSLGAALPDAAAVLVQRYNRPRVLRAVRRKKQKKRNT